MCSNPIARPWYPTLALLRFFPSFFLGWSIPNWMTTKWVVKTKWVSESLRNQKTVQFESRVLISKLSSDIRSIWGLLRPRRLFPCLFFYFPRSFPIFASASFCHFFWCVCLYACVCVCLCVCVCGTCSKAMVIMYSYNIIDCIHTTSFNIIDCIHTISRVFMHSAKSMYY